MSRICWLVFIFLVLSRPVLAEITLEERQRLQNQLGSISGDWAAARIASRNAYLQALNICNKHRDM